MKARIRSIRTHERLAHYFYFVFQQEILDSYTKEQSANQKSLDHIERLQKTNFMLLQRQMSGEKPAQECGWLSVQ